MNIKELDEFCLEKDISILVKNGHLAGFIPNRNDWR